MLETRHGGVGRASLTLFLTVFPGEVTELEGAFQGLCAHLGGQALRFGSHPSAIHGLPIQLSLLQGECS